MAIQKLLVLIEVDEDKLVAGNAYTELPNELDAAISKVNALDLKAVYLLNPKIDELKLMNKVALNYHHYAVSVRGEKCQEEQCEQHHNANVILFHDHTNRHRAPPGVN
jgi:hypothetical protein